MKQKLIELRDFYQRAYERFDKIKTNYRDNELLFERYCIIADEYSVFIDRLDKIINQ